MLLVLNAPVYAYTIHIMISILKITVKPSCFKEDTVYCPETLYTSEPEQGDC